MAGYERPQAFAVGVATVARSGAVLDVLYPLVNSDEAWDCAASLAAACGHTGGTQSYMISNELDAAVENLASLSDDDQQHENLTAWHSCERLLRTSRPGGSTQLVATFIDNLHQPPIDTIDAYFRLHLLSHRKVVPNSLNLNGIFSLLHNVVWTNLGPFEPEDFELARLDLVTSGERPTVLLVDKFPRMVDYVIPSGVRIADANRVRLGAHLAEGTTVMHEGYCNFNAGTLGPAMVEGRISQGVSVGQNSDVGGGASIMGTLSGGGNEVITIGKNCLLGANSGLGISLGDGCVVEAGLYLTAGTVVTVPDGTTVKALELSGRPDLLYRRNSVTGAVEALSRGEGSWRGLNAELHSN